VASEAMRGTDGAYTGTPPTADAIRNAILDRVLSGNHDTAGTAGKLLQDTAADVAGLDGEGMPTGFATTTQAEAIQSSVDELVPGSPVNLEIRDTNLVIKDE
jgi:hypothetical protein